MKITFYRSETNDKGELYKSPILSVTVPASLSESEAVAAAIKEFREQLKVPSWQSLAEFYEIDR